MERDERIAELHGRLDERPDARLRLVGEGFGEKYLEIENFGADGDFEVRMDLRGAALIPAPPKHTVFAAWQDGSADTSKHIPSGGSDRVHVHSLDIGGSSISDDIRWVDHVGVHRGKGYSWTPGFTPEGIPSTHRIKLIVSAKPPLRSGNKIVALDVTGDEVVIIEGEIESAPGYPST